MARLHGVRHGGRGRQPCVRHGVRPRLRTARPARQDDGNARARTDPARADGLARARRRSVRALPAATELGARYEILGNVGEPDADHRDRARVRDHRLPPASSCASRSSARRCARSRTTGRSPQRWACRCAASRRPPGSAPGSCAALPACCSPDLLTSLDYAALTFLVISSLAAALIGRLQSLWATLFGGLAVGLAQAVADPLRLDLRVPRRGAVRARDRRAALLSRRRVVTISRAGRDR